MQTNVDYI